MGVVLTRPIHMKAETRLPAITVEFYGVNVAEAAVIGLCFRAVVIGVSGRLPPVKSWLAAGNCLNDRPVATHDQEPFHRAECACR